jgi:hypothetical protein
MGWKAKLSELHCGAAKWTLLSLELTSLAKAISEVLKTGKEPKIQCIIYLYGYNS